MESWWAWCVVWSVASVPGSHRVSLVKGHADGDMVRRGQVCELDRIGNDVVDEAADFGRWRVHCSVIFMLGVGFSALCGRWYRVVRDLHHFFIAVSRAIVIDDCWDGTDIHMVVWAGEGGRYVRSRITPCFPALFRFGVSDRCGW